ncbi:hypothetical protein LVB87_03815 [Lysobacter sp. KIS68-7]|uniref:hypothetical protein n=1 Tax=Lysobacter sp. KIS68-7 TaxID=2904252 RepID=UPI001E31C0EF|nr:hypothetical protein [Lysobacter sp. KIS68-7]UHQ20298.1 hypothetical protein LVB87_03815 [Lysobacter sp. KIS68-7]
MESKEKSNVFWPKIDDLESAINAERLGSWAAFAVAAITVVFTTIVVYAGEEIGGIGPYAYVDAVMFAVIGWRIRRHSRGFAVAGLALWIVEKGYQIAMTDAAKSGAIMGILLLLMFISGVRGTFAYHRFKSETPAVMQG